jgi:putative ABC transport system permease protein
VGDAGARAAGTIPVKDLIALTPWDLALASLLVVVMGLISVALRLGLARRLGVASVRTVVQLSLVGLVLEWVFTLDQWPLVLAVAVSMIANASVAAVRRTTRRFRGVWLSGITAVTLSSSLTTWLVVAVVVGARPWWTPQYLLPLLGMVLGNTLTGLSLTLDRLMRDLDVRQAEVEQELAVGATLWEATRPLVQEALRTGLIPILNSMSVAGLVSLPGMMTGQILAGAPPLGAVAYQIVVMFMIAGATSLGALIGTGLVWRSLATPRHQLATHRMTVVDRP